MQDRIMAIVRLVLMILAAIAIYLGITFDWGEIYDAIAIIVEAVLTLWAWWKNNNLTSSAIEAQEYLEDLKEGNDGDEDC